MNNRIRIALLGGFAALLASCGGSSGGGTSGVMFVESCNLGCNSGSGGAQVSCAFANTPLNASVGLRFSRPVDFGSVNSLSFSVTDTVTGLSAPGNFLIDPLDANRLVFRPLLDFDGNGNPVFGLSAGSTYLVVVKGTAQGDTGSIIRSTGGALNQSRVVCQITADQGIVDAVPGPPNAFLFVENTSGATVPAGGAVDVSVDTPITMVFDDIMNVGTLVTPSSGVAPFIRVLVDSDGNLADPSDQVEIQGTYTFVVDQFALRTTLVFVPAGGLPSAGPNPVSPRQIIVRLPVQITDLAANQLANAGDIVFTPEVIPFNPITIQEDFLDQTIADLPRTGTDWAETTPGRLKPGVGGGSGRLGDLFIRDGETVVLETDPTPATGAIEFTFGSGNVPTPGDQIILNGVTITVQTTADPTQNVAGNRPFGAYFCDSLIETINQIIAMNPGSPLDAATYSYEQSSTNPSFVRFLITNKTVGSAGNLGGGSEFSFDVVPGAGTNTTYALVGELDPLGSGLTFLQNGSDGPSFAGVDTVSNFDFQANPGAVPPDVVVTDGIFEFNRVSISSAGGLRLRGNDEVRMFVRGNMRVEGIVNASGTTPPNHLSRTPEGQFGGRGGPGAGKGGDGADRVDNPGSPPTGLQFISTMGIGNAFNQGISNPTFMLNPPPGGGVGQTGSIGGGFRGVLWPNALPPVINAFPTMPAPGLETTAGMEEQGTLLAACVSGQVGGAGGGGSYATSGTIGVARAEFPASDPPGGNSNTPPDTPAGDAAPLNIEPPTAQPNVRLLRPRLGHLRGGAGGGGGGMSINLTQTNGDQFGDLTNCVEPGPGSPDSVTSYYSHSGAGGGGGGGGLQLNVGRDLAIPGVVSCAGGSGGSAFTSSDPARYNTRSAAPGGGGTGGSILAQCQTLTLPQASGRLTVAGGAGGLGKLELPSTGGIFQSTGGDGGTGLVRVETLQGLTNMDIAGQIAPNDTADDMEFLSVGAWMPTSLAADGPQTISSATSCWVRPAGSFFNLDFDSDVGPVLAWDLSLVVNFGAGPVTVSYRDATDPNNPFGNSIQQTWGDLVASDLMGGQVAAPIAVRFQGAKTTQTLTNPCVTDPFDVTAPFAQGSVTPWVRHPEELNAYTPKPDAVRFCIIFDRSSPNFPTSIEVDSVRISAIPE